MNGNSTIYDQQFSHGTTSKTSIFRSFFGPLKLPFSRGEVTMKNPPFISDFPSKPSNL